MNPIDIALRIATTAHAGQLDRDGYPVILHPLTVGLMGHTDEEKMAGFLHDVVEDSHYTFQDLLREGIPIGVVNALRLLTHHKETNYYDYVQSIIDSKNPIALQVKYNDLQHNFARGKAYPDLQENMAKHSKWLKQPSMNVQNLHLSCTHITKHRSGYFCMRMFLGHTTPIPKTPWCCQHTCGLHRRRRSLPHLRRCTRS